MRLKIIPVEEGINPRQLVVSIAARDGDHFLAVDRSSIAADSIDVGNVLGRQGDHLLVELPEETDDGRWRLWVTESDLIDSSHKLEAAE